MDHGSLHDISLSDASDLRAIEFVSAGCAIAASEGHRPYSKCLLAFSTSGPVDPGSIRLSALQCTMLRNVNDEDKTYIACFC